jgi:hypothetical protein
MKRATWVPGLAVFLLAAPLAALPGAPYDQYEPFNRDDSIIQDHFTRLYWQRTPAVGLTRAQALAYCDALTLDYTDWRVPTVKELLTLVDDEGQEEFENNKVVSKFIDRMAFPKALPPIFWTSSVDSSGAFFVVDFTNGQAQTLPDFPQAVRCVRL